MNAILELVAQLGSDDQVKAYQARQKLADIAGRAPKPGNDDRSAVAAALAGELTARVDTEKEGKPQAGRPKHSAAVRNQVCQYLSQVADDAQVPALAEAAKDLEAREMARWALERIGSPAATAALVAALDQVGPEFRVGVINALARRKAPDVVAALHRQAGDEDAAVRLAAVESLATIPEPSSDDVIVAATKTGSPRARARAQKARVRLAETLRLAGNKEAAISIYKSIVANDADEPQKKAAQRALEQLT